MPIKFRCQHCRQFLGISRSKAGQAVDCPTCGRTVRVPNLDGSIEPIPEPKLNVDELAGALSELARIGDETEGLEEPETAPAAQPSKVKVLAPLPKPEPITLAPPPEAVAVDFHAEKQAAGSKADPLAELAANRPSQPEPARQPGPVSQSSPFASPAVLAALLAMLIVGAVGGWMIGRGSGSEEPSESSTDNNTPTIPANPTPVVKTPPVYHPDNWKSALQGQITYHSLDGRSHPDTGARIIVLPESRKGGQSKLATAGFWANADEADFRVALAGLRELGGNAVLADKDGKFELNLPPTAGTFQILLISHYKQRDPIEGVDQSTQALARTYFDRPDALIKQLAYKQHKFRFDGSTVETWNHAFE